MNTATLPRPATLVNLNLLPPLDKFYGQVNSAAMLLEHREQRDTRRNRHDDSPYIVGTYSVEQIKEFNERHDRVYGWTPGLGNVYLNPLRLPETYIGKLENLWSQNQPTQ